MEKLGEIYSVEDFNKYAKIFKKHEENPFMKDIARGMYGFQWELENFYDISHKQVYTKWSNFPVFSLEEEKPYRIGKIPKYLLEILQDFHENPIDNNKLTYEFVRNDFQPPETREVKIGRKILLGTATAVAIGFPIAYYFTRSPQITSTIAGLTGLAGGLVAMHFLAKSSDNGEKIFYKLFEATEKADSFRLHYVTHKCIEKSNQE